MPALRWAAPSDGDVLDLSDITIREVLAYMLGWLSGVLTVVCWWLLAEWWAGD